MLFMVIIEVCFVTTADDSLTLIKLQGTIKYQFLKGAPEQSITSFRHVVTVTPKKQIPAMLNIYYIGQHAVRIYQKHVVNFLNRITY